MGHDKDVHTSGVPADEADGALILLHGRGASAEDILSLRHEFPVDNFFLAAPQATNYTWYPFSFLAPRQQNEPWLTSALDLLDEVINDIVTAGLPEKKIFIAGFSQGACLSLEFATRRARRWGGVAAFTGGLIGEKLDLKNYTGNFDGTPVFIGNSDRDPHVPEIRSAESAALMKEMGAEVTYEVYPGLPHTITRDEIKKVNQLFFSVS